MLTKTQWILAYIAEQGIYEASYKDIKEVLRIWDYGHNPGQFLKNLLARGLIKRGNQTPLKYKLTRSGKKVVETRQQYDRAIDSLSREETRLLIGAIDYNVLGTDEANSTFAKYGVRKRFYEDLAVKLYIKTGGIFKSRIDNPAMKDAPDVLVGAYFNVASTIYHSINPCHDSVLGRTCALLDLAYGPAHENIPDLDERLSANLSSNVQRASDNGMVMTEMAFAIMRDNIGPLKNIVKSSWDRTKKIFYERNPSVEFRTAFLMQRPWLIEPATDENINFRLDKYRDSPIYLDNIKSVSDLDQAIKTDANLMQKLRTLTCDMSEFAANGVRGGLHFPDTPHDINSLWLMRAATNQTAYRDVSVPQIVERIRFVADPKTTQALTQAWR